jgi:putative nucleotidyltransferase with HDIG domain
VERDLLGSVVNGDAWREDVEAFAEATGATVTVLRPGEASAPDVRCAVCLLPTRGSEGSRPSLACFTPEFSGSRQNVSTACRGGIRCVLRPLRGCGGHILVSGFVSSDAERRELLSRLLGAGLSEKNARAVVRATPALRPRAAAALAELAASHLDALLASAGEADERLLELIELNELSKALNADTELERITYIVTSVLDKAIDFEVGGIILLGDGEPCRAVLRADVPSGDLASLLAQVAGTPLGLERCELVQLHGNVSDGEATGAGWTVISADLSSNGSAPGCLFAASRDPDAFARMDDELLAAQAAQATSALERSRTHTRMLGDLTKLVSTLSAMADVAERTHSGHAGQVMSYAVAIGHAMGLPHSDLEALRFAALLHDIGKIGVAEEIILKPDRLTADEMTEVKRHSEIGASLVDQMEFLDQVAPIVMHHHERWDGGGYPAGLAGEDIPLTARILAVADSFGTMTRDRAYSKALPITTAWIELERGAGTQFDPSVVAAFLRILDGRAFAAAAGLMATPAHRPPERFS